MIIDDLNSVYKQPLQYRLILRKPNGESICTLPEHQELEHFTSLKETDTLDFKIPYYLNEKINPNFSKILTDYQIYMELWNEETETIFLEHVFKITSITNTSTEDGKLYKNISCKSLEIELQKKFLMSFTGSKVIYRTKSEINSWIASETYPTKQSFIESGILNVITNLCPSWNVDESNIDSDINLLYRYFEIDSTACLDFLLNDSQNSFLCIFEFDTVNKKIGCRNLTHLGIDRGFFISNNNFIKSHTEDINSDDVVTRLYIYGKDEINIRSVNPTGEEYILDLSYYRNNKYMSQSLLDALNNYDALLATKQTEFATLLASLNTYTSQLSTKKSDLILLQGQLKALETNLKELIEEGDNIRIKAKQSEITTKNNQISTKESEISSVNTNIKNTNNSIETLQSQILMTNNFTMTQISELDQFIKDKTTTDNTILTPTELYAEGKKVIASANQPLVTFNIDIIDLFSIVEEQMQWNKIKIGDIGTLRHEEFNTDCQLRLLAYTHNYESNKLTLTFANRNNLNDPNMIANQIKSSISTTTSLDIQKYKFLEYVKSGDKSAITSYINNILDLGAQGAVAGTNQEVKINEKGITLTNPAYPNRQVRLMSDGVYLTTDGWQSAKYALTSNGINAEVVRGILGEFCQITADKIVVGTSGEKISDDLINGASKWNSIESNIKSYTNSIASDLQAQIDGNITMWFYDGIPTLSNEPAKNWDTDSKKNIHLGDLCYDNITGYVYRFRKNNNIYEWIKLTDVDITKALQDASKAQDTADNKRRVFISTPTPPYDIGDLWAGGSSGDLKKCITAKIEGQTYSSSDWELASKYTDNTVANQALNKANNSIQKDVVYNNVQINSELGIKASHADGSFTQMKGDGFLRYVSIPNYTEIPIGIPNKEDFTINNTLDLLLQNGWVFSNNCSLTNSKLLIGSEYSKKSGYAKVSQYITKQIDIFSFNYKTSISTDSNYCIIIDNQKIDLDRSETEITKNISASLSEGMHTFEWCCYTKYKDAPDSLFMYIDNIIFEQNPIKRNVNGYSSIGQSYNYMHFSGEGSTALKVDGGYFLDENMIPDVWVELPEMFKNKQFKINVYLQDTGQGAFSDGVGQIKISVIPNSIDYVNARFKVSAKVQRIYLYLFAEPPIGSIKPYPTYQFLNQQYWQGCDFVYTITC